MGRCTGWVSSGREQRLKVDTIHVHPCKDQGSPGCVLRRTTSQLRSGELMAGLVQKTLSLAFCEQSTPKVTQCLLGLFAAC